ncbi:MAG: NAD(P)/FAD-dependent oxidoreductase [Actinobacteria bacterium]|nr:NAD(P)/FAD-dependent oxidoreductase [Actinomycetota bacterium]
MHYDVIIAGAGIAGLTSAAFLAKSGLSVLIVEKNQKTGGLISSFKREGFTFDGGIRAMENSGVLFPMLRSLGINMEFIKNNISIGLENDIIRIKNIDSLSDYQDLLNKYYPAEVNSIAEIIAEIKKIMSYVDIIYGIENPMFLDIKNDRKYFIKVVLPWLFKYITTIKKIEKLKEPVNDYLKRMTSNLSLIDIITQHFFKDTPVFFALSYFKLYSDYFYPKGGTYKLPEKLAEFALNKGADIKNNTEIIKVEPGLHQLTDKNGNIYSYKKLIWAADLKSLYKITDVSSIKDYKIKNTVINQQKNISGKVGGDSIFTLYLGLDIDKKYFFDIASEHFFYTPYSEGLSNAGSAKTLNKEEIIKWLERYFKLTSYEISCPVLRDENLAPEGKTGLIISTLFDYSITKKIFDMGWYDEFKTITENIIIDVLNKTVYPGFANKIICRFSSTPLTLSENYGNSEGAITGWAFTNSQMPVESRLPKIANSINTPIPDVLQAGQWAFSPTGLPTSIMTGKMASDKILKQLI